jgi:hypothetical protein
MTKAATATMPTRIKIRSWLIFFTEGNYIWKEKLAQEKIMGNVPKLSPISYLNVCDHAFLSNE